MCAPRRGGEPARSTAALDQVAPGSYLRLVRSVGLKVLKNRLAEYVRIAAAGETVLVTDRDRVVAELSPPRAGRAGQVADSLLADLVREGVVTPALLPPGTRPRVPPGGVKLAKLLAELERDRGER